METLRTIRCKLAVNPEDLPAVSCLFELYAQACTRIASYGQAHRESNAVRLHPALYRELRTDLGLPANLVVTALRRAAGALKTACFKGRFQFRSTFIELDARTFTLKLEKGVATFSSPQGKRISAALEIGAYQHEALWGAERAESATLVRARDGFYANIVVQGSVPESSEMGVLGIRNLAVTSGSYEKSGRDLLAYRQNRWRIRASLQSKGTKGAKRALKRLSGREKRYAAWVNHNVAKEIVASAAQSGCSLIRMEDLRGIRSRTKVWNKHRNRLQSHWSFGQLQGFVAYKAAAKGIRAEWVNARNSSRTCHKRWRLGIRERETFICTACGIRMDADKNAAYVIAAGGADVNRPESNGLTYGVT